MSFLDKTGLATLWAKIKSYIWDLKFVYNPKHRVYIIQQLESAEVLQASTEQPQGLYYITGKNRIVALGIDRSFYSSWIATSSYPASSDCGVETLTGVVPNTSNLYTIGSKSYIYSGGKFVQVIPIYDITNQV